MGKNKRKEPKGIGKLKAKIEKTKADMVSDYSIIFENKYKRPPTQTEIDRMYERATKVVNKNVRKFGVRLAAVVSIVGISTGAFIKSWEDDIKALPEGQKQEQSKDEKDNGEKPKEETFLEGLYVGDKKITHEIENLDSVEEVENYLNKIYVEAYEQITGNENLEVTDFEIIESNQNYVYELEDDQIVTHGKNPAQTEKKLKADGKAYTTIDDMTIYNVVLKDNSKVIDSMTSDFEKVIPGDNYEEMKDYESVLAEIGQITKEALRLEEVLEELEEKPDNEYLKSETESTKNRLTDAVIAFNNSNEKNAPEINENQPSQEQSNEDNER